VIEAALELTSAIASLPYVRLRDACEALRISREPKPRYRIVGDNLIRDDRDDMSTIVHVMKGNPKWCSPPSTPPRKRR